MQLLQLAALVPYDVAGETQAEHPVLVVPPQLVDTYWPGWQTVHDGQLYPVVKE